MPIPGFAEMSTCSQKYAGRFAAASALGAMLVLTPLLLIGQPPSATISRSTNGVIQVFYPATTNAYYRLLRTTNLNQIASGEQMPVDVRLPSEGTVVLSDVTQTHAARFYRVQEVPVSQPLDSD